jgi:hypothetical protein
MLPAPGGGQRTARGVTARATRALLSRAVLVAALGGLLGGCVFDPPRATPLPPVEALEGDLFEPEPARRAGLVPSPVFWLAQGDGVRVSWQDYLLLYPHPSARFPQCRLCPHELRRCSEDEPDHWCFWCLSINRGGEWSVWGRPTVKVMEWQLPIGDTADQLVRLDYRAGCVGEHPDDLPVVVPTRDAALQLLAWLATSTESGEAQDPDLRGEAGHAELRVHVVRGNRVMEPRPLTAAPDGSLQWQVPGTADRWDENFSDRLWIAEIRPVVYRMAPGPRGTPVPVALRAVGILGGPRCLAGPRGVVVLAGCRATPDGPAIAVDATPTYLAARPRERLTWVVELDGTPLVGPGEALGIEFWLGVKP